MQFGVVKRCVSAGSRYLVHTLDGLLAVGLRHVEDCVVAHHHVQHIVVLQLNDPAVNQRGRSAATPQAQLQTCWMLRLMILRPHLHIYERS